MSTMTHRRSQHNLPLGKAVAELFWKLGIKTQLNLNPLCFSMIKQALKLGSEL
jgi:hypothetical protein